MFTKIVIAASVMTLSSVVALSTADAARRHHRGDAAQPAQAGPKLYPDERYSSQFGQPGSYGAPGNLTPGYSSTARTPPTNTNGE